MKKVAFLLLFLVALLPISGFAWWKGSTGAPSNSSEKVRFVIPKGKSASQVSSELYKNGLIKSPLAFKLYVRINGTSDNIQAGEFELPRNLTLTEVLGELSKGPLQLWVTIPEGLRREEVADRFVAGLQIPDSESEVFETQFLEASKNLEGKLFPDTYLFPRDATGSRVATRMNDVFKSKVGALSKSEMISALTDEELLVLASLVERETKGGAERPVVAGIIMNRINIGMPLQIDASVQYAIASSKCKNTNVKCDWWPILTLEDLSISSPYNTYKNNGLPAAPIASPGLSAITASYNPESSEYFYYIHDPKGVIHYAKTLEEHNANVAKYLRN